MLILVEELQTEQEMNAKSISCMVCGKDPHFYYHICDWGTIFGRKDRM